MKQNEICCMHPHAALRARLHNVIDDTYWR